MGAHTNGKARSQITVRMADGAALHLSTDQYATPQRVSLYDAGGIAPDYEVLLSDEDEQLLRYGRLPYEEDEQLQQAIALLK